MTHFYIFKNTSGTTNPVILKGKLDSEYWVQHAYALLVFTMHTKTTQGKLILNDALILFMESITLKQDTLLCLQYFLAYHLANP